MNCAIASSACVAAAAVLLGAYHQTRHVAFKATRDRPIPNKNWSGEVSFAGFKKTARRPGSIIEVQRIVEKTAKDRGSLKVVGSGHSWTDIAVPMHSNGTMVSLDRMDSVLEVDKNRMLVTVQAGMRVHDFYSALAGHGLGLTNVPSVDEQAVGGVIATASHGAGLTTMSLSASVHRV